MSTAWIKSRERLNILQNWWKRDNFKYSVMFLNFVSKKVGNSYRYYLNIILLFRSRSQQPGPEPVLKFAWSRSRKIKKGPAPATLVFVKLCKQYVKTHLEFATPAWNPWLKKDIGTYRTAGKSTRKGSKIISGLSDAKYQEKCIEVRLELIIDRRENKDLIQTFKIR